MSRLLSKTFLEENRKIYLALALFCICILIFFYFISQIITAFTDVNQAKVESDTAVYLKDLENSINVSIDDIKIFRSEDSIVREGNICNLEEYRGSSRIGCPILIPDLDQYGNRYNPFEINN